MKQLPRMRGGAPPLLNELSNSAAGLGLFMATVYLIIGIVISLGLIGLALYLLIAKGKYTGTTDGTVKSSSCEQTYNKKDGRVQSCFADVQYNVDNKTYSSQIHVGGVKQEPNSVIPLMYDVKNPNDVQRKNNIRKIVGWVLIGIAVIIIVAVWVRYYIVKTYKIAAVATGVGESVGIAASAANIGSSGNAPVVSNGSSSMPVNSQVSNAAGVVNASRN
jgi:uncharacterized membrane protein YraQ (UPF0718 family)